MDLHYSLKKENQWPENRPQSHKSYCYGLSKISHNVGEEALFDLSKRINLTLGFLDDAKVLGFGGLAKNLGKNRCVNFNKL